MNASRFSVSTLRIFRTFVGAFMSILYVLCNHDLVRTVLHGIIAPRRKGPTVVHLVDFNGLGRGMDFFRFEESQFAAAVRQPAQEPLSGIRVGNSMMTRVAFGFFIVL